MIPLLRSSIQNMRSGFLLINSRGIIEEVNPAVGQILDIANVQGEHFESVFTTKLEFLKRPVDRVFSRGASESSEIEIDVPDEEMRPVHKKYRIQLDPVLASSSDPKPEVTGVVLLLTDVSSPDEQKLAEFLSVIFSDLRTPLAVISGYAEMAATLDDIEFKNEALEMILLNGRLMKRMISGCLDFYCILAGKSLAIGEQPFNLRELFSGLISDIRAISTSRSVVFDDLDYRTDREEIVSDRERIASICGNILINAMKYSPEEKENHVRLVVTEEEDFLRIAVADQGIGIPKDQQEKMFKPYFQVQTPEHSKIRGLGLGLYLSRCTVEALGGTIGLESEWKRGSTFYFTIPIGNKNAGS